MRHFRELLMPNRLLCRKYQSKNRKFQKRNGIMSVLSLFLAKAEMRSVGDWSDFDPNVA